MKTRYALAALVCVAGATTVQGQAGGGWTNPELQAKRMPQQRYDAVFRSSMDKCTESAKEVALPFLSSGEARCGQDGPAEYANECASRKKRTATVYREALVACMFDKGWLLLTPVE